VPQLGIDPEHFQPGGDDGLRDRLGLRGQFVVGFVGRLVRAKGVQTLIDALALLSDQAVKLLVVGSGAHEQELRSQAHSLGLEDRIRWVPAVAHEGVLECMRAMDVLVLPSIRVARWKEQFGHVLIEAMSCEIPVVGSDSGEIPNVIGDAGLVYPEGDARALATCLEKLIADEPLRRDLAMRGRRRAVERFTHKAVAQRCVQIYEQMVPIS
jgi:glycosyltransferase involved in cell wall biosynthesis